MPASIDDQTPSPIPGKSAGKLPEKEKRSFSKGDARYWMVAGRLFKDHGVPDYSCRFSHRGQRNQVCLNTSNQREAAKRAAELFNKVSTEGWSAGLVSYRPEEKLAEQRIATVGALIEEAEKVSSARVQTLDAYTKAFRLIVAEVMGISKTKNESVRRATIDSVPLLKLSTAAVLAWRNGRLRKSAEDPLAKRRAVVTTNSLLRNARALFGKKLLPFIEQSLPLPRPLPFDGVAPEKAPSMRYVSKMDPFAILGNARADLMEGKSPDPESFKVILLALVFGLRRSEIDHLLWTAFDFSGAKLQVASTEYHELKSEDSAGDIDIDADTLAIFRGFRAKHPDSIFVVERPILRKPSKNKIHGKSKKARLYRCEPVFARVMKWLRSQGVESRKPIHTLRKEIGSVIASEHGIFAASRYLRHSNIQITSDIYADQKKTITPATFAGVLSNNQPEKLHSLRVKSGA